MDWLYSRDYQRQDYIGFLILRMSWQFLNHTNPEASPSIFKASPCQRIQLCKSTYIGSHHSHERFASTVVFLAMRLDTLQIDLGLRGFYNSLSVRVQKDFRVDLKE